MKKQFRIAILVNHEYSEYLTKVMSLAFGRNNVMSSDSPRDLFGLLNVLKPHLLIVAPDLFERHRIRPEDIVAYRKKMKYRIVALYSTEESLETKPRFEALKPDREYVMPKEYLTMIRDVPGLCSNYVKRKQPLMEKTWENLDRIFRECGFRCDMKGYRFLKEALFEMYFNPALHRRGGATKLYNSMAEKYGTTPRIIARSMLRFLETSWDPKTEKALRHELNVPEFYSFVPINFGRFTEIFNTYYTIRYGDPRILLDSKKQRKIEGRS